MRIFGESDHLIDDKGRINIPRKFQPLFEQGGFLTRAFNGQSLVFYSRDAWAEVEQKLGTSTFTELSADVIARYLSCGTEVHLDGQGRLSVPPNLRRRAKLEKDVTLIAMGEKLEIWDSSTWQAYNEENLTTDLVMTALQQISHA